MDVRSSLSVFSEKQNDGRYADHLVAADQFSLYDMNETSLYMILTVFH